MKEAVCPCNKPVATCQYSVPNNRHACPSFSEINGGLTRIDGLMQAIREAHEHLTGIKQPSDMVPKIEKATDVLKEQLT